MPALLDGQTLFAEKDVHKSASRLTNPPGDTESTGDSLLRSLSNLWVASAHNSQIKGTLARANQIRQVVVGGIGVLGQGVREPIVLDLGCGGNCVDLRSWVGIGQSGVDGLVEVKIVA